MCCMHGSSVHDQIVNLCIGRGLWRCSRCPGTLRAAQAGPIRAPSRPPDSGSTHAQIIGSPDGLPNGRGPPGRLTASKLAIAETCSSDRPCSSSHDKLPMHTHQDRLLCGFP